MSHNHSNYKHIAISVLVFFFSLNFGYSQDSHGINGGEVTPTVISVQDVLNFVGPYSGPIREIPEGEPPYAPKQTPPLASNLSQVTYDKIENRNEVLAPVLGAGFEGITQNGYIPSEPTAAAGPLNIFSPGNIAVTITNKDGSNRVQVDGASFFGAPASEGPISDAVCCYDALRGRFVALCFTQGSSGGKKWSYFYLSISQTSDARGSWWRYKFDWRVDGSTTTSNWGDFEEFGFSDDKLVLSGQQFSFGGNQYKYQKLRVIDRAKLYSGQSVTWVDFVNFPAPPGGSISNLFVTKPGRNLSSPDNTIYVLTTRYNGGSNVAYRNITGTPSSPVLSSGSLVSVNTYGASVNAKGGSSTATVAAGDCRTPNFVVRNGNLHIAWHFGINFGSGTVDAVRYLKLNVSNINSPVKVTDETFGADGIYYYYPSCTVDNLGNMFIGFGRSSSSQYPSSYVSGKRTSESSIEASALAKGGTAVTSQSRWGDYTGIDMDESASSSSQSVAWYAGQWTKASNNFGTWLTQLTFSIPGPGHPLGSEINRISGNKPDNFDVSQNYPNPSNPKSLIHYQLPSDAKVTIKVFNTIGSQVAEREIDQTAGYYTAEFDGTNLASGIYFYKLTAIGQGTGFEKTIKIVLVK